MPDDRYPRVEERNQALIPLLAQKSTLGGSEILIQGLKLMEKLEKLFKTQA